MFFITSKLKTNLRDILLNLHKTFYNCPCPAMEQILIKNTKLFNNQKISNKIINKYIIRKLK